jgi:ribonuclease P protein component
MVLHLLPERPAHAGGGPARGHEAGTGTPTAARAGFVVGRSVGNSVVRHRVTRRLRAAVRAELDRLPVTADLVVRARPEAATANSADLRSDLRRGLDRLLDRRTGR